MQDAGLIVARDDGADTPMVPCTDFAYATVMLRQDSHGSPPLTKQTPAGGGLAALAGAA